MQVLRNTYAENTLMPHFGGGEKASVETRGCATGWEAAESACTGATTASGMTNGYCETDETFRFFYFSVIFWTYQENMVDFGNYRYRYQKYQGNYRYRQK